MKGELSADPLVVMHWLTVFMSRTGSFTLVFITGHSCLISMLRLELCCFDSWILE